MPSFLLDLSPSHQQQAPVQTRSTASTRRNRRPSSLSDDPSGTQNLPLTSSRSRNCRHFLRDVTSSKSGSSLATILVWRRAFPVARRRRRARPMGFSLPPRVTRATGGIWETKSQSLRERHLAFLIVSPTFFQSRRGPTDLLDLLKAKSQRMRVSRPVPTCRL